MPAFRPASNGAEWMEWGHLKGRLLALISLPPSSFPPSLNRPFRRPFITVAFIKVVHSGVVSEETDEPRPGSDRSRSRQ